MCEAEARQARSKRQKIVAALEKDVIRLEELQKSLAAKLEDPETYKDAGKAVAINRELQQVVEDLALVTAEWEKAATQLAAL